MSRSFKILPPPGVPTPSSGGDTDTIESDVELVKASPPKHTAEGTEEAKKVSSGDNMLKAPIRIKDNVGRKFSFPFHMCKTWKGIKTFINQAFLNISDLFGLEWRRSKVKSTPSTKKTI